MMLNTAPFHLWTERPEGRLPFVHPVSQPAAAGPGPGTSEGKARGFNSLV